MQWDNGVGKDILISTQCINKGSLFVLQYLLITIFVEKRTLDIIYMSSRS